MPRRPVTREETALTVLTLTASRRLAESDRFAPIGCLVALLALFSPRLALFAIWLFSDLLSRSFDSWLVPLLGFLLLPWTTLAYAVMWAAGPNGVEGFEWFVVILGFFFDLGAHSQSGRVGDGRRSA